MIKCFFFILPQITAIVGVVSLFCYCSTRYFAKSITSPFHQPVLVMLPTNTVMPKVRVAPIFTPTLMPTGMLTSTTDSTTCNDLLVLIDKTQGHALPASYVPPDLVSLAAYAIPAASSSVMGRQIMVADLQRLFSDIENDGITGLEAVCVYRSYDQQSSIYNSYVQDYGITWASRFSAQHGHSQHQLGTAVDFSTAELGLNYRLSNVFEQTKAGQWLAANAYKYGFYISYPYGKEKVTGYEYAPWHFRYIGVQNAQQLHRSGLIMQQYLAQIGKRPL